MIAFLHDVMADSVKTKKFLLLIDHNPDGAPKPPNDSFFGYAECELEC